MFRFINCKEGESDRISDGVLNTVLRIVFYPDFLTRRPQHSIENGTQALKTEIPMPACSIYL